MPAKPKPVKEHKQKRVNKERERKVLEKRLEALVRHIVYWRDSCVWVERDMDGVKCRGVIQWGHFLTRHNAPALKYDLGNSYCQCASHNLIHDKNDMMMVNWFMQTFGNEALNILINQ